MKVADEHAGKTGKCKGCGNAVRIPAAADRPSSSLMSPPSPPVPARRQSPPPAVRQATPVARYEPEYHEPAHYSPPPQQQVVAPTVNLTNQVTVVNNIANKRNSLAVWSLGLAIIGCFLFWIPFVGMGIGGLAVLLGFVGFFYAFSVHHGMIHALVGGFLGLAVMFWGSMFTLVGAAVVASAANPDAFKTPPRPATLPNKAQSTQPTPAASGTPSVVATTQPMAPPATEVSDAKPDNDSIPPSGPPKEAEPTAELPTGPSEADEKRAAARLKNAKEYLSRPEFKAAAKTTLEKIVSELPGTKAAQEAEELLKGLN